MSQLPIRKLLEEAFLAGYRRGVETYAHWKDGEQLVGSVGTRLSDALKHAEDDAKPYFDMFLDRQRAKFEETRK